MKLIIATVALAVILTTSTHAATTLDLSIIATPPAALESEIEDDLIPRFGSGSHYVDKQKRDIIACTNDPGSVCIALAGVCAASFITPPANLSVLWEVIACTAAALWCGSQLVLEWFCCLGKLPHCTGVNFGGTLDFTVSQGVVNEISTFSGTFDKTFTGQDLLHAIQGNGGGSLEGNPTYEGIINDIMIRLTGSANGNANVKEVENYLANNPFVPSFNN